MDPINPSALFEQNIQNLSNPAEEVAFLRERLNQLEASIGVMQPGISLEEQKEAVAERLIDAYHEVPGVQVLNKEHAMSQAEVQEISLNLEPEEHDTQMEYLYSLMIERGIKNALTILDQMHNSHLTDDFHRFLVQYLLSVGDIPGMTQKNELYKPLHIALYEVSLPRPEQEERRTFKEFISMMEQFYAGMQSVATGANPDKDYYTLELALASGTDQVVFYAGIPHDKVDLFEKQVIALFPHARVEPVPNDYNIFSDGNISVAAHGEPTGKEVLLMRTYDQFETDPIDVVLNVFSKLDTHSEGAALQFVIAPAGDRYIKEYGKVLDKVRKGEKLSDALKEKDFFGDAADFIFSGGKKKDEEKKPEDKIVDQTAVESIVKKLSNAIVEVNVRCVVSAPSETRAKDILREITSAFNQFTEPQGNGIAFKEIHRKRLEDFLKDFSFRIFDRHELFHMNIKELATLYHFPALAESAPQLKQAQAATAPAPLDMPQEGILLGYNIDRGRKVEVHMMPQDRLRHFYVIGQTGTGKSGTLLGMVQQDMKNGDGLCYIDPHGSDVQTILSWVPEDRIDDVIYFDPGYMARPMGLNMLEFDPTRPEQKTLIIDELMGIFNQLFDMQAQGGAMFQQYFKNSAFLVMEHPESGNTLLEITRVLGDEAFRKMKMQHCKNPIVRQFWINAEKTTGDQSLANFVPYISSKFDPLISNEILRPVITQEKSAFNIREIMDNKKILLVNLSKGRLGELNANLLGLILVGKIQMAALGRADSHGKDFPPFYLYIDEFQNVTTPSIASILSEARKYKLSLNVAHQFLAQLDDKIKNAVMGNVGSMQIFRISSEDAKTIEPRVAPVFTASDIMKLDNRNAYMSMLINGRPTQSFNIITPDWPKQNKDIVEPIKEMSYLKYGRPRNEVEAEIMAKYDQMGGE